MTLAEKIAARQAERSAAPAPLPGKPKGLVLSSKPETAPAPTRGPESDERSLALPHGQAIDMTPANASPEVATWHQAMNAFETELVVTNDPQDPTHFWLAVFPSGMKCPAPILLHRLQFFEHPQTNRPANCPF
jgi:hypothetical protein